MRRALYAVLPLVALTLWLSGPQPAEAAPIAKQAPPRLLVLDLQPVEAADEKLAALATEAMVSGLKKRHPGEVVSLADVRAMLDAAALKQLLGCEDERCQANVAHVIDAGEVATGKVGQAGGKVMVFTALIDAGHASIRSRTSRVFDDPGAIVQEVDRASLALLSDDDKDTGEDQLAALRTAVVLDSFGERGALRQSRVEACLSEQLISLGTPLVDAAQVARIKEQAGTKVILKQGLPDALSIDEVDVLVVGTVDYGLFSSWEGAQNFEGSLDLQVIKVDTGEVIVRERVSKQSGAVNGGPRRGIARAAERLCEDVVPRLSKAMETRRDAGNRVVLSIDGPGADLAADRLRQSLRGISRAGKHALRRRGQDAAILDVVLKWGDGVALAVELERLLETVGLNLSITDATAGKVDLVTRGAKLP